MAARTPDPTVNEIIRVLQDAMRRIRLLEENQRAVEAKMVSTENSTFRKTEESRVRINELETSLKDLNTKFVKLETEVSNVKKFLNKVALKNELQEFKGYLDLMSPLRTHYTSEADVKRLIGEHKK